MTEKKPAKRITLQKICCYQWVKHGLRKSQSGLIIPNYESFLEKEKQKQY